ncbi:MAG TPA: hypothetical protein VEK11_05275 [Thermoanaerobaculia bacterium]|jgi:hypothetical protein|nr:hypothetical protein [Thermoanaerobaculia bacterium]
MPLSRTKAVLEVLRRGRDEKIATNVLRIFGASSIDECMATYDAVGAAERATIDDAIARVTAGGGAAFELSVENKML